MHKAGSAPPDALASIGPLTEPMFVRRAACARDGEPDPTLDRGGPTRSGRAWLALWLRRWRHRAGEEAMRATDASAAPPEGDAAD